MLSGIIVGSIAGAVLAHKIQGQSLELIFGIMIVVMAIQMIIGFKPRPHTGIQAFYFPVSVAIGNSVPASPALLALFSSLFSWHGQAMRGVTVSVRPPRSVYPSLFTATISYMILGWSTEGLPEYSLGYVYLPGTFGLMIPSMLMAVVGAKLAHWSKLPAGLLKRAFGVFGLCVGISILIKAI